MIRHELREDDGILIVSPEASLTSEDFISLARDVDPYIERKGGLAGLLIESESFPGWRDFGALISHLRFVRDHHRKIRRVAVHFWPADQNAPAYAASTAGSSSASAMTISGL